MSDDLPPCQEPPGRCGKVLGSTGDFLDGEALNMDPTALLPFQWAETSVLPNWESKDGSVLPHHVLPSAPVAIKWPAQ